MAHYKLILAYEGTEYHGFQRQKNNNSVQAEFEAALRELGWSGRAVMPAGRTDSGVHARGQIISFSLDWKHGTEMLVTALNAHLPADIAVQAAEEVQLAFHPRYDALSPHVSLSALRANVRAIRWCGPLWLALERECRTWKR